MENFYITKPNSRVVSCVREVPDDPEGIVIAIHGFSSNKECPTFQVLMQVMPEAGLGVVGIDLPGHGTDASYKEELRLANCMDSIEAAEKYAAENWPGVPIYYFSSSFGAYVAGLYISSRPHLGRKAFFRSGAVNMRSLFVKDDPTEAELKWLADLSRVGYFDTGMDLGNPVRVTIGMYHDFEENDLFEKFDPDRFGHNLVSMAHGEDDTVIDPEAAKKFSEKFGVPLTLFPDEGHSLSNDPGTPYKVAGLAAEFYKSMV